MDKSSHGLKDAKQTDIFYIPIKCFILSAHFALFELVLFPTHMLSSQLLSEFGFHLLFMPDLEL